MKICLYDFREFEMAEIEYFVDPLEKETHPKFENVANLEVTLFSGCDQLDGKGPVRKTLGDAVKQVLQVNVYFWLNKESFMR